MMAPMALTGWNLRVRHRPDVVVAATTEDDVLDAVRQAATRRMPVRVQATGHGALAAAEGGLLLHTGAMRGVRIDAPARIAHVRAGARWHELLDAAHPHALTGLTGSSPDVGIVGFALSGGAGWLVRPYGLCSNTIEAVRIVTADGRVRWVDEDHEPDLFWACKGGAGNLGVVTELRLRLLPVREVFAGSLYWPIEQAAEVVNAYRHWVATLPQEVSSSFALQQFPPVPAVPAPLRGRAVVAVRGCYPGDEQTGAALFAPLFASLRKLGEPLADTFGMLAFKDIGTLTNDPVTPMPRTGHSTALGSLSDTTVAALLELARPGAPFVLVEARHVGGGTPPPADLAGLGHWSAEYLLFTQALTPDPAAVDAAADFGSRLLALTEPDRTGLNALTFVLTPPDPADALALVRSCFTPEHAARLAKIKAHHDPTHLFGGDRSVALP